MCVKSISLLNCASSCKLFHWWVKEKASEGGFVTVEHLWKWVGLALKLQCSLGRSHVSHFCPKNSQHYPAWGSPPGMRVNQ